MINATFSTVSTRLGDRLLAGIMSLSLGLLLLAGAGFAGSDFVHNAAHDTRHALGFPCH